MPGLIVFRHQTASCVKGEASPVHCGREGGQAQSPHEGRLSPHGGLGMAHGFPWTTEPGASSLTLRWGRAHVACLLRR